MNGPPGFEHLMIFGEFDEVLINKIRAILGRGSVSPLRQAHPEPVLRVDRGAGVRPDVVGGGGGRLS